ncbi:uncharacterized protein LOC142356369 isoform X1 [Convolutriloba macropyga]|uniref:uncharacterized protein LOC142356369 isoform X1 n=1 Tax=Convolutriloba macropyga TaxID=536237 RepID=UPI003F51D4F1
MYMAFPGMEPASTKANPYIHTSVSLATTSTLFSWHLLAWSQIAKSASPLKVRSASIPAFCRRVTLGSVEMTTGQPDSVAPGSSGQAVVLETPAVTSRSSWSRALGGGKNSGLSATHTTVVAPARYLAFNLLHKDRNQS